MADLARAVLRGWVALVLVLVVSTSAALYLFSHWPEKYDAKALLTVAALTGTPLGGEAEVNMQTEQLVASSDQVVSRASEALGGSPGAAVIKEGLVVSVPKGAQVLEFQVTSTSPAKAAETANAVAEAYQASRVATAQRIVEETTQQLTDSVAKLEGERSQAAEGSTAARALDLQIQAQQERLAGVAAATFYSGTLVSPASPPSASTRPSIIVFIAAALGLGLLVGVFAALVFDRLRRGLREASLARSRAGGPVSPTIKLYDQHARSARWVYPRGAERFATPTQAAPLETSTGPAEATTIVEPTMVPTEAATGLDSTMGRDEPTVAVSSTSPVQRTATRAQRGQTQAEAYVAEVPDSSGGSPHVMPNGTEPRSPDVTTSASRPGLELEVDALDLPSDAEVREALNQHAARLKTFSKEDRTSAADASSGSRQTQDAASPSSGG